MSNSQIIKICKECIIPNSFPNINFEEGLCSFCRNKNILNDKKTIDGYYKLGKILKSKKGNKYDCLVPISGGKDSSFILFYVVKIYGLKPLALYVNSGFSSEIAQKNVKKICNKLSVDLIIVNSTIYRKKAVKEALQISKFLKRFIRGICFNCENNNRTYSINEAVDRDIPIILWGSTPYEDAIDHYNNTWKLGDYRITFREPLTKKIVIIFNSLKNIHKFIKPNVLLNLLKFYLYIILDNIKSKAPGGFGKFTPFLKVSFRNKKVKTLYFYDYINYNPSKQIELLNKELDWEKMVREDCKLNCFQNYAFFKKTGITHDGFILANLVRNGMLDRRDAIEKEKKIKKNLTKKCKDVIIEVLKI